MVYRGKPSGGCATCRKRKIKCDQRAEGCLNCAKAKRECPGYRDLLDLRFLNETETVVRKSQLPKSRTLSRTASPGTTDEHPIGVSSDHTKLAVRKIPGVQPEPQSTYSFISPIIFPSEHELGEGFFFTNYVVYDLSPGKCVTWPKSTLDPALISTSRAVGLAGLASVTHSPNLMTQARQLYLEAVHSTNAALRSPELVRKDSTLISTMLLSHFETMAGSSSASITAWKNHIHGGAALLKLRGVEQLRSVYGARLFVQVVSSLNLSCIRYNMPIPEEIMYLANKLMNDIDTNTKHLSPWFAHWRCSIDFTNFNARLRNGQISDPREMYTEAKAIDDRYAEIFAQVLPPLPPPPRPSDPPTSSPTNPLFETVHPEQPSPLVFNNVYHTYTDFFIVQMLDSMRANRIILSRMIRVILSNDLLTSGAADLTSPSPPSTAASPPRALPSRKAARAEIDAYAALTRQLSSDILASVPQHLGFGRDGKHRAPVRWIHRGGGYKFLWSNFEDVYYPFQHSGPDSVAAKQAGKELELHLDANGDSGDQGQGQARDQMQPLLRMFGGFLLPLVVYLVGKSDLSSPDMRGYAVGILEVLAREFGLGQARVLARDVRDSDGVPDSEDVALEDAVDEDIEEVLVDPGAV